MHHLPPPPAALIEDASLFLDFDGTLVELADRPDAIDVDPALRDLIAMLAERMPGRVAIVSGRSLAQLDGFLGDCTANLCVVGSHGAEQRAPVPAENGVDATAALARAVARFAPLAEADPRLYLERKSFGVGLHFRQAPEAEAEILALARAVASDEGLVLQHGKMMAEVRAPGDKGAAVRRLMAHVPAMAGTRPLVFGDDVTDEDGFAAAADLGGAGVLIGEPRRTVALYALPDVTALREWLAAAKEPA